MDMILCAMLLLLLLLLLLTSCPTVSSTLLESAETAVALS
jgi:hypothetical protein